MITTLRWDRGARELRLCMTDLSNGQHERYEYRLINDDGSPLKRGEELDGHEVFSGAPGDHYIKLGPWGQTRAKITTEQAPALESKTPCRRLASRSGRAKCALCPGC
jgi:hypothetical protein